MPVLLGQVPSSIKSKAGTIEVIWYVSQALSKSESHYPAHKLEFLALKWAVTESFQEYLYGNTFAVYSWL